MTGADNESKRAEVLAVIPARGGSKGLPRKNILPLAGKPLIAYSIQAALASSLITRVVVSTDDEEIAEISRACGAEVPFMRPAELAGDRAKVSDAINHILRGLEEYEGYKPRVLATLYPTHPFRTPELLDELVQRNLGGCRVVSTVVKMNNCGSKYICRNSDKWSFLKESRYPFYRSYGLYEGKVLTGEFKHNQSFYVLEDDIFHVDIDTWHDFHLAEEILRHKLFNPEFKSWMQ